MAGKTDVDAFVVVAAPFSVLAATVMVSNVLFVLGVNADLALSHSDAKRVTGNPVNSVSGYSGSPLAIFA